jgi:hypothetical protein
VDVPQPPPPQERSGQFSEPARREAERAIWASKGRPGVAPEPGPRPAAAEPGQAALPERIALRGSEVSERPPTRPIARDRQVDEARKLLEDSRYLLDRKTTPSSLPTTRDFETASRPAVKEQAELEPAGAAPRR